MPLLENSTPENLMNEGFTVNPGLYFRDSFVVTHGLTGAEKKAIEAKKSKEEPEVGFLGGLENEWGAVLLRKGMGLTQDPLYSKQYVPTDEQRWKALKDLDYSLDRYRAALKGADSLESFEHNLKVIKGVQDYRDAQERASLWSNLASGTGAMFADPLNVLPVFGASSHNLKVIKGVQDYRDAQERASLWSNLASGTGAMFADPLNVLPVFGASSAVGRVGYGAVTGMLSGQLNNYTSGDENDALMDIATGMAFGASIEGIARASKFRGDAQKLGDASRRAQKYAEQIASGVNDVFKKTKVGSAVSKTMQAVESKLPTFSVQGAIDKIDLSVEEGTKLKSIFSKLVKSERGDKVTKQQFTNEPTTRTAEEARDYWRKNGELKINRVADNILKILSSTRMDADDLDELIRRRRDGYTTSLDGNELFEEIIDNMGSFYGKLGDVLQDRGMISGTKGGRLYKEKGIIDPDLPMGRSAVSNDKFESRWLNRRKVADFLNSFSGNYRARINKARTKVYNLLMKSLDDPEYYKLIRDKFEEERAKEDTGVPSKSKKIVVADEDFMKWVQQKAWSDALGYVDQGEAIKKGLLDDPKTGGMAHDYQHERMPWKVTVKDADGFSVSRLQTGVVETLNGYLLDDPKTGGMAHDYQHERMPWKVTVKDADGFSVSRLQTGVVETLNGYNAKVAGDLGLNEAFGVTSYKDFKTIIDENLQAYLKATGKDERAEQATALRAMMNDYYGRSGMDSEDLSSWGNALADAVRNFTLFTHNAFMGVLNHFEIAEGIKEFGASFFFKSIPGMPDKIKDWSKGGMTKAERDEFINMSFGQEARLRGAWREIYDRNLDKFEGNAWKARLCSGSQWLASNSPFTKYLVKSQETIVSQAQGLFVQHLTKYVHGKLEFGEGAFLDDKVLRRLNIAKKDFEEFTKALKQSTEIDKHGRLRWIPDAYINLIDKDVKNITIMRRLGDYVASEVIQRQSLVDTYLWRGSKNSPYINLLTQFKNFAIRSYNKRLAKSVFRLEEGDAAGQAMTWFISGALGTLSFLGQTFATSSGMNDEQRAKYYERVFGVKDLKNADFSTILRVCINGMTRSNILAAPSTLASFAGINTSIKSTSGQGEGKNADFSTILRVCINGMTRSNILAAPSTLASFAGINTSIKSTSGQGEGIEGSGLAPHLTLSSITANVPALQTLRAMYDLQADTRNLIEAGVFNSDEYLEGDRERIARSFGRSLKAVTPNAPFIQQSVINYITDQEDN